MRRAQGGGEAERTRGKHEPGAEESKLDEETHLTPLTSAWNICQIQSYKGEIVSYRKGKSPPKKQDEVSRTSAAHMLFDMNIQMFIKTHLHSVPLPQIQNIFTIQNICQKARYTKYTLQFCASAPTCAFKTPEVNLEENVSHFKAVYSAGALDQITCLCCWGSHRKEWKSSRSHIDISKGHQCNITRKRTWIQPPPLILKLVNNYLGGISYVLILVGL